MTTLLIDILLALKGADKFGLPLDNLLVDLRRGRHRSLSVPQLESALRDLADRSFTTPVEATLSGTRWRITALGLSALQEEGLA
ncbi:hypothetical protein [Opitutus sp. ER46]|uniref:hypothetical protein n=1 Tax=Opitutus sp. ER46 TaxID=2161864 RepID=UPI000D30F1C3|nr:hypothetical protein [Opitutus sp. ER46]PTX95758.1 hypothetical protein DB354_10125 [Opitutus sp. ER46]